LICIFAFCNLVLGIKLGNKREDKGKDMINRNRSGFTLIELLVAIAIAGILTSIVLINTRNNPDRDVNQEKDRFISFLRDVQSKSLAADKVNAANGKVCGFGVHASGEDIESYYVDTGAGNGNLDVDCTAYTTKVGTSVDTFRTSKSNIKVTMSATPVFFLIPSGDVYINGMRDAGSSAIFTVTETQDGKDYTAQITITGTGLVY
jgi:prepilin-type N-terminal cleavage/methylation domain-containing protein